MRKTQKVDFKEIDPTKEYAETHYYQVKYRTEHKSSILNSVFWADFAKHVG
jgi:hypothetical protein